MAHRSRGRFQKKIDVVHWTGFEGEALALASATTVAITLSAAQHLPETLLRIRGEWSATLDGALIPGTRMRVTAGMILVPEGTSTSVLWNPETDADAPWIWWDCFGLQYDEGVVDNVSSAQQTSSRHRVIDSKAMRKVRNTELQFVIENASVGAATTSAINAIVCGRVLAGS